MKVPIPPHLAEKPGLLSHDVVFPREV